MEVNEYISNRLISEAHEIKESDPEKGVFRGNALLTAANNIRRYDKPITSGYQARMAGLQVGEGIARRIDEYLKDYKSEKKPESSHPPKKEARKPVPKGPVIIPPSKHVKNLYISQKLKESAKYYRHSDPNKSAHFHMAADYIEHSQQHAANMNEVHKMSSENKDVKASQQKIEKIMREAYPIEYRPENIEKFKTYKKYCINIIKRRFSEDPKFKKIRFNVIIAPENISGEGQDNLTYAHYNIIFSSDKVNQKEIIDFLTPSVIREEMGNNKYRLFTPKSFENQYYAIINVYSEEGAFIYNICTSIKYIKAKRAKEGTDMYFYVDEGKCVLRSEIKNWWKVYFNEKLGYCCTDKVIAYRLSVILRMMYIQRCETE